MREAVLLAHRVPSGFLPLRPRFLVAWIGQPKAQGIEALPGVEVRGVAAEADLEIGTHLARWHKLKLVKGDGLAGTINRAPSGTCVCVTTGLACKRSSQSGAELVVALTPSTWSRG